VVWTIFKEEEISCPYRDWNTWTSSPWSSYISECHRLL